MQTIISTTCNASSCADCQHQCFRTTSMRAPRARATGTPIEIRDRTRRRIVHHLLGAERDWFLGEIAWAPAPATSRKLYLGRAAVATDNEALAIVEHSFVGERKTGISRSQEEQAPTRRGEIWLANLNPDRGAEDRQDPSCVDHGSRSLVAQGDRRSSCCPLTTRSAVKVRCTATIRAPRCSRCSSQVMPTRTPRSDLFEHRGPTDGAPTAEAIAALERSPKAAPGMLQRAHCLRATSNGNSVRGKNN